jgi:serine/threonine protein kinase
MASVFRARDESLGRDIAVKLFSAGGHADVSRFREELRVLANLSHHGVVSIVDAGIDESSPDDIRPFLVMELVRGGTLRDAMRARRLSSREAGEMTFEVAEALDYVHAQGVIHRDITPANIMLTDYGTRSARRRARITDFGIAIDARSDLSAASVVTGTAAYLSPEQVRREPLSPASDIYSLGLVLLECFTGGVEFPGNAEESALARVSRNPRIPSALPGRWRSLLRDMTARKPADRPTAADVAEAARRALK